MIKIVTLLLILADLAPVLTNAQPVATTPKKKPLCNPLVMGQPATKRLSLIYEMQPSYAIATRFESGSPATPAPVSVDAAQSLRLTYSKNLVMKPKLYMSFTAGYWHSRFQVANPGSQSFARLLSQRIFHAFTASTNLFKPLNSENFLLINLSVEATGNGEALRNLTGDNFLAGGALLYGWKKGVQRMWGLGVFRGYRLGRVIHVPALLYNRSFNKKWGVEALLPARAQFRYSASAKSMWLFGYDLDGTQFALQSKDPIYNARFLQRGEIRPRIGWEKQLSKYWAFSTAAGLRFNGRFDVSEDYAGRDRIVNANPRPALFVQAGFHLLNFPKKKKS
ncbi:MAG: hypothetical protein RJA57_668 [Bacteroidota bacterium]|jgi:hypothetical protein